MYDVSGIHEIQSKAMLEYSLYEMRLTQQDRHQLQIEPLFVPSPKINVSQPSIRFKIPLDHHIKYATVLCLLMNNAHVRLSRHIQLLADGRCLLITQSASQLKVFLERYEDLERRIELDNGRYFHCEKIGHECLLAYDESKRMLAVCGVDKVCAIYFIN